MRDLAKNFLNEDEQRQVEACVREVEAETAAEVVPYIAAASHHYPRAELAGRPHQGLQPGILRAFRHKEQVIPQHLKKVLFNGKIMKNTWGKSY